MFRERIAQATLVLCGLLASIAVSSYASENTQLTSKGTGEQYGVDARTVCATDSIAPLSHVFPSNHLSCDDSHQTRLLVLRIIRAVIDRFSANDHVFRRVGQPPVSQGTTVGFRIDIDTEEHPWEDLN